MLAILAATEGLTKSGFAQQPLKFVMNPSGSEEVPPVPTETFSKNMTFKSWKSDVTVGLLW